ncbi:Kelch-like protein 30 [Pseudocercospora fuligena]|uniref:Kelch-like protein 30 n=1 Tax=Pseudocercospora fuligena TaxID=685502 RepID=A0A8H6VHG4_9PEZI|nr:Kelch-like protein 30 [Pseudocercospora fuligena]
MEDFTNATQAFFNDEKFSDLTIVCGTSGKQFKAHRILASSHSKWFARCCSGSFAESQSRRIELKDDQPEALERMIQYFYKFDYDEVPGLVGSKLELHAWMVVISDKYEIPSFQKVASKRFMQEIKNNIDNPHLLIAAATIIYENLPYQFSSPSNGGFEDSRLHIALADAWIARGCDHNKNEHFEELTRALAQKAPAFAAHIQARVFYTMFARPVLAECLNCDHKFDLYVAYPTQAHKICPQCNVPEVIFYRKCIYICED